MMNKEAICQLINREMTVATGCTEPAAVALAAAAAREYMQEPVVQVHVRASINVIKNVMAVHIPGIQAAGIEYAAALGATGGVAARGLRVIDQAAPAEIALARQLVEQGRVSVSCEEVCDRLFVSVELLGEHGGQARVELAESHTNIVKIEQNKEVVFQASPPEEPGTTVCEELTVSDLFRFVQELSPEKDDLHMIKQAIRINGEIMEAGKRQAYGLNIGNLLQRAREKGYYGTGLVSTVVEDTACGVDARMAGVNLPVVTNAGSGNQGITTTVPVLSAGAWLGCTREKIFRGVVLSNLAALYIHGGFGRLSGLCGATIAATGAACGIVYLLDGNAEQIGYAINNMLGDISGMLCDGAKADCALKVSTCLQAAFQCAFMAMENVVISPMEGIVEHSPEKTIENFNRLGNEGSAAMDSIIMDILINKRSVQSQKQLQTTI